VIPVGILAATILGACTDGQARRDVDTDPNVAYLADLPVEIKIADERIQQAYRYALIEADLLAETPCYCGCVAIGHKSNEDCYVSGYDGRSQPEFDLHALGCDLCVDITQDAVRMKGEGKSIVAIRAAIDSAYSRYGPPTVP
jgi:hypothetical protein